MNQHNSLTAYHERKKAEAELELERLRQSTAMVKEVPSQTVVHCYTEPCDRHHIGPGAAILIGLGTLVVLGAIFGSRD